MILTYLPSRRASHRTVPGYVPPGHRHRHDDRVSHATEAPSTVMATDQSAVAPDPGRCAALLVRLLANTPAARTPGSSGVACQRQRDLSGQSGDRSRYSPNPRAVIDVCACKRGALCPMTGALDSAICGFPRRLGGEHFRRPRHRCFATALRDVPQARTELDRQPGGRAPPPTCDGQLVGLARHSLVASRRKIRKVRQSGRRLSILPRPWWTEVATGWSDLAVSGGVGDPVAVKLEQVVAAPG
jgi:hypothetical protein